MDYLTAPIVRKKYKYILFLKGLEYLIFKIISLKIVRLFNYFILSSCDKGVHKILKGRRLHPCSLKEKPINLISLKPEDEISSIDQCFITTLYARQENDLKNHTIIRWPI